MCKIVIRWNRPNRRVPTKIINIDIIVIKIDRSLPNFSKNLSKWQKVWTEKKSIEIDKKTMPKLKRLGNLIFTILRGILGPSWGPKSIKNRSKNRSLGGSLFLIDFWSIFRGFWCQLGLQNRSKIDKNRDQNMMTFWADFLSFFYRFLIDVDTLKPWFLTNSPREIPVFQILLHQIVKFIARPHSKTLL